MVRLEEIDANGITLYSPLMTQHDLLWLFPGPWADYWLSASQLKPDIMLQLYNRR